MVQLQQCFHYLQKYLLILELRSHCGGLGCFRNFAHREDVVGESCARLPVLAHRPFMSIASPNLLAHILTAQAISHRVQMTRSMMNIDDMVIEDTISSMRVCCIQFFVC
jgi:hypothetical protein